MDLNGLLWDESLLSVGAMGIVTAAWIGAMLHIEIAVW
jgi:hypothetical protein